MGKLFTVLYYVFILVISLSLAEKIRYDNHKLYSVTPKHLESLKFLRHLEEEGWQNYNFWTSPTRVGTPVSILVAPEGFAEIEKMAASSNMDVKIVHQNVQQLIDDESSRSTVSTARSGNFGWDSYHTLDEINSWLISLVETYPNLLTTVEGGKTYENRTILGVKLSYSNANANNTVFLEATIHAREWIAPAVQTYILNEFLTSNNASVRQLAESYDWYFFPIFNPDGYEYSHTTDRMWRKTRVPHSILCAGADPNRNWNYHWGVAGTSASPCSDAYRGPAAFSEPLVRSAAEFIESVAEKLVAYISFHSFGQMLLLPYGHTSEHLDNYDLVYDIGLKAAETLRQRYGTEYVVGTIYDTIYPASGSSVDWVKGMFKTPIAYGYELRDRGEFGFLLPADQIVPTALETLDSFITIFEEYEKSKD
ncbi:hypothetical protein NQ318_019433 [Aromia moschata]|uniref:Zinc carboxypeptidase A 1 n=1 Tax=Aromia moschata TaxID=1265417 RepID=A0AAV8XZE0_9CUCU|nr:hypothetical protein NQ318_019433 [Aromia moschata]